MQPTPHSDNSPVLLESFRLRFPHNTCSLHLVCPTPYVILAEPDSVPSCRSARMHISHPPRFGSRHSTQPKHGTSPQNPNARSYSRSLPITRQASRARKVKKVRGACIAVFNKLLHAGNPTIADHPPSEVERQDNYDSWIATWPRKKGYYAVYTITCCWRPLTAVIFPLGFGDTEVRNNNAELLHVLVDGDSTVVYGVEQKSVFGDYYMRGVESVCLQVPKRVVIDMFSVKPAWPNFTHNLVLL
ncbi:hypothetical protein B0J18DRAFT_168751 [Chaetomium sp. MPI-SDFR-AT-0129]|nr:hypothetical protein B0J18DRAFT_168751 [Chaetomium sp. MPI-SDFR-AT-0129]